MKWTAKGKGSNEARSGGAGKEKLLKGNTVTWLHGTTEAFDLEAKRALKGDNGASKEFCLLTVCQVDSHIAIYIMLCMPYS